MRMSRDHILTSQAGSLPRPDDLLDANSARESGAATDEAAFEKTLQAAVVDVVRKQKEIGITVPGDGEFGKSMGHKVNYRAWWSYCFNRLGGLDLAGPGLYEAAPKRAQPGEVVLTSFADRRDRTKFLPVYQDPDGGVYTGPRNGHSGQSAPARSSTKATTRSKPTSPISRPRSKPTASRKAS